MRVTAAPSTTTARPKLAKITMYVATRSSTCSSGRATTSVEYSIASGDAFCETRTMPCQAFLPELSEKTTISLLIWEARARSRPKTRGCSAESPVQLSASTSPCASRRTTNHAGSAVATSSWVNVSGIDASVLSTFGSCVIVTRSCASSWLTICWRSRYMVPAPETRRPSRSRSTVTLVILVRRETLFHFSDT
ncbi:hypothetical protein BFL35_07870 [Clavibacter michiganensis]|nr:hypothetical protein BFL35_07870 [Clavibacter michiganensis]